MLTPAVSSGSSAANNPPISNDPQVVKLKAEIKDWSNCPTTPAPAKKQIVSKLQTQLDGVVSTLEDAQSIKQQTQTGNLDIRV